MTEKDVLFDLVRNNDHHNLKIFLETFKSPDARTGVGKKILNILKPNLPELLKSKNARGQTPLLIAIEKKFDQIVSLLIEAGVDINQTSRDELGQEVNPFFTAIFTGNVSIVSQLIGAGVDVNYKFGHNYPLHQAAYFGLHKIVPLLIKAGADINATNDFGETPLFSAAFFGHNTTVSQLIAAKADVNKKDELTSPLYAAALWKHTKSFELLIDAGAGVCRNITTELPAKLNLNNKLMIGFTINNQPVTRKTPGFEKAITSFEELRAAIDEGVPFKRDDLLVCFNYRLVKNPNHRVIKELREMLCSVLLEQQNGDSNFNSALTTEPGNRSASTARELSNNNNNHNDKDRLFGLIENNDHQNLKIFLNSKKASSSKGVSGRFLGIFKSYTLRELLRSQNAEKKTPLILAIEKGFSEIIGQLIDAGADVNHIIINEQNSTYSALWAAIATGKSEVVSQLLKAQVCDVTLKSAALLYASYLGHDEIVKLLIEEGANADEQANGSTSLHYAATSGFDNVVAQLIAAKASVSKTDKFGRFPLQVSAQRDKTKSFELLLDAGAGIEENIIKLPTKAKLKNKLVIGLRLGHKPVTRTTPGFENAITSLQEFLDAIYMGVPFNRGAILARCDYLIANYRANTIFKELRNMLWIIPIDIKSPSKDLTTTESGAESLFYKKWLKKKECVKAMEAVHLAITIPDQGGTLLHLLAENNIEGCFDKDIIELVKKYKANLNHQNGQGQTIFHLLISNNVKHAYPLIIELIKLGADFNIKDNTNRTPLDYLLENLWEGNMLEVVDLLRNKARPSTTNLQALLESLQKNNSQNVFGKIIKQLEIYLKENEPPALDARTVASENRGISEIDELKEISQPIKDLFRAVANNEERKLFDSTPQHKITFALAVLYVYWQGRTQKELVHHLLHAAIYCLYSDRDLYTYQDTADIYQKLSSAFHYVSGQLLSSNTMLPTHISAPPTTAIPREYYFRTHPLASADEIFLQEEVDKEKLGKDEFVRVWNSDQSNAQNAGRLGLLNSNNNNFKSEDEEKTLSPLFV